MDDIVKELDCLRDRLILQQKESCRLKVETAHSYYNGYEEACRNMVTGYMDAIDKK